MGLTAAVSSSAAGSASSAGVSASVTSLLSPVGLGVGGIFVAATLALLLAYLDLIDAADGREGLRKMVVAAVVPLGFAFGGIVLFHSLQVL